MALIKKSDLRKMSMQEKAEKLRELQFESVKAKVTAHKATAKTKEIKRARARLNTFMKHNTQEALQK